MQYLTTQTKKLTQKISLGKALWLTFGILVATLIIYNSKDALFGSKVSITTTPDGSTVADPFLPIGGIAKHARALLINGREIVFDRNGTFADGVLLSPGYNIVEVAIRDQFGKVRTHTYHVVLDAVSAVARADANHYQ